MILFACYFINSGHGAQPDCARMRAFFSRLPKCDRIEADRSALCALSVHRLYVQAGCQTGPRSLEDDVPRFVALGTGSSAVHANCLIVVLCVSLLGLKPCLSDRL